MARPFRLRGGTMVKGWRLWGMAALCVFSGSGWIMAQVWPSEMGYPFSGCIHFALIGCVAVLISLRGVSLLPPLRSIAGVGVAGVCLFALPALALHLAAGTVSESSSVVLFCSVPVMTIVGASYFEGDGAGLRGLMLPSVVALGGALLLFPVQMPKSSRGWVFFGFVVGCCAIVAAASVRVHRLLQGVGIAPAVSAIGFGGAAVLGCYGLMVGWVVPSVRVAGSELLRGAVFDLPVVWLTVWLMREVHPARLSARFLLVPLVSLVDGYVLLRVPLDGKTVLAMAAMAGGAMILLVRDEPEDAQGLLLR